jgi:adenylate kinase family enzyme
MRRVVVIGNTCAGKTTLGERLARSLAVPLIDLDALYWSAGWKARDLHDFRSRVREATNSASWVLAGSYSKQWDISWSRADTVLWLDVALR